jgi:hypothetical protein
LALETAIGEQTAAAEAEARAAEQEAEFQNELSLERIRQSGGGAGGLKFSPVDPVSNFAAAQDTKIREGMTTGAEIVPEQYRDNPEPWIDLQRRKRSAGYALSLIPEASPEQIPYIMSSGQFYLYKNKDGLPIVTSNKDLALIFPGQEYVEYDRAADKSTVRTKPLQDN